jgi:hypothetical protein
MVGAGATFHNAIGSVGSLFQADTINHNEQHFHHAASPSRAPLHASLRQINRTDQIEQLVEAVQNARWSARTKPLVVVLDGRPEDELLSFVQRLGEHDFEKMMMLPCDYLGCFDWPRRGLHMTILQLLSAISEKREEQVPLRADAAETLAGAIAGHGRSLAFAHVLDPETCRGDLLREWTRLICTSCANPANGLLICFLCVQRRERSRRGPDPLAADLALLAEQDGWCLVDPLSPIGPMDLEQWIARYNRQPVLSDLEHIDPRIAERIFERRRSLRYREAVERVLESLAPSLKPEQPRWAA